MTITFSGYTGRAETLTNFPVLVVLSNNVGGSAFDYHAFFSTSGWDLRFRDAADTTNLNYEIESWNPNGASYVWVQVPLLTGDGATSIQAAWGDPADTNQLACTTNGATWDSSFVAVWHMGQTNAMDSTAHTNNGLSTANTDATGLIGGGQGFNGVTSYIDGGNGASLNIVGDMTLSAWVKPTLSTGWGGLVSKYGSPVCLGLGARHRFAPEYDLVSFSIQVWGDECGAESMESCSGCV